MARILKLHPTHPQKRLIRQAAEIVHAGGVIAYRTDACYALGCRIGDSDAARRIRRMRGVDARHHLTVVCRDLAEVGRFARMDDAQFRVVKLGSDGAFTFLLRATPEVPRAAQHPKRSTVGVRIPRHPVVLGLLEDLGEPILSSTLLLPDDTEPLYDPAAIAARLGDRVDAILDGGNAGTTPTTLIDLVAASPKVLRRGLGDPAALGIQEAGEFG